MKETLAVIAALLAVVGNISYLRDTVSHKISPHPYTWLVWSVVTGITLMGQITKGAGVGALPAAVAECFTVAVFVFSLRHGFANIVRSDNYYLAAALLGLIPWAITHDPTISVIIAVAIDLTASTMTIRKTWRKPASETPLLYGANVLRHILTLFSLQSYNIATTLHSIAMLATNTTMTSIIILKNPRTIAGQKKL